MTYRPEIDGLRTVAVLAVLFFHAEFELFSGGFIGVDVFFVISGYLITSVILKDISKNKFSFLTFYEKRVRRLLPSLFFIMSCCLPFVWVLMTSSDAKSFFQTFFASTIFSSNFLFWFQSGNYFDTGSIWKPLHHTWSLAIEEQFYLFHPILLIIISKLKFKKIYLGILMLISILLCLYFLNVDSNANFYLLPSRYWELLAGGIIAYYNIGHIRSYFSKFINDTFVFTGLTLIVYSIVMFNSSTPHPSLLTIIPVLGTVLIIIFADSIGFSGLILSNRLMVFVGLISYSLYLWHYPIFVFSRLYIIHDLTSLNYIILILVSILLSYFTYKFIEQPFRNRSKFKRKTIFSFFSFFSLLFLTIGASGHYHYEFNIDLDNEVNLVLSEGMEDAYGCHGKSPKSGCLIGDKKTSPSWAILGDSHAGSLSSELGKSLESLNESGVQLTQGGCAYTIGLKKSINNPEACNELNLQIRDVILNDGIKNIVISARYVRYLYETGYDNEEGGKESDLEDTFYYDEIRDNKKQRFNKVLIAYKKSIEELLINGKKIYFVYPVPEIGWDVPRQTYKLDIRDQGNFSISYKPYIKRSKPVINIFDELLKYDNFIKIDPSKLFCNIITPGRCETSINGKLLYFDDDHVSNYGAKIIINEIINFNQK